MIWHLTAFVVIYPFTGVDELSLRTNRQHPRLLMTVVCSGQPSTVSVCRLCARLHLVPGSLVSSRTLLQLRTRLSPETPQTESLLRLSHSRDGHMQCRSQASPQHEQPGGSDLLIVGPGVLGSYVGTLWQQQHPEATVIGQTNSTSNHDR